MAMSLTDDELDPTDFQEIGENNFQQIKNKATKLGFADGVHDGRKSVFQKGFDEGYKDGLRTSFNLDRFRYFFKNLNKEKVKDQDLIREKQEYERLDIKESKSQQHFQYLQHQDKNLNVISQNQQEYVNEIVLQFAQKLPKATDLLKAHSETDSI